MARNGKIARLPGAVREALNQRIYDGEQGDELLNWLNEQPEVIQMTCEQFNGSPINKQNLSEWRLGGYQDWNRHQQSCAWLGSVESRATELELMAKGAALSDRLSTIIVMELGMAMEKMLGETDDANQRCKGLMGILEQVNNLRRADHRRMKLKIEQDRWAIEEREKEQERVKEEKSAERGRKMQPIAAALARRRLAGLWGKSKQGAEVAEYISAVQHDLPVPMSREEIIAVALAAVNERAGGTIFAQQAGKEAPSAKAAGEAPSAKLKDPMGESRAEGRESKAGEGGAKCETTTAGGVKVEKPKAETRAVARETSNAEHRTPNVEAGRVEQPRNEGAKGEVIGDQSGESDQSGNRTAGEGMDPDRNSNVEREVGDHSVSNPSAEGNGGELTERMESGEGAEAGELAEGQSGSNLVQVENLEKENAEEEKAPSLELNEQSGRAPEEVISDRCGGSDGDGRSQDADSRVEAERGG